MPHIQSYNTSEDIYAWWRYNLWGNVSFKRHLGPLSTFHSVVLPPTRAVLSSSSLKNRKKKQKKAWSDILIYFFGFIFFVNRFKFYCIFLSLFIPLIPLPSPPTPKITTLLSESMSLFLFCWIPPCPTICPHPCRAVILLSIYESVSVLLLVQFVH